MLYHCYFCSLACITGSHEVFHLSTKSWDIKELIEHLDKTISTNMTHDCVVPVDGFSLQHIRENNLGIIGRIRSTAYQAGSMKVLFNVRGVLEESKGDRIVLLGYFDGIETEWKNIHVVWVV